MTTKIVRGDGVTVLQNVKTCSYSENVNAETNLKYGCVSASKIDVIVYGSQSDAVTAGEELKYYQVVNGVETLIGTFYAEPVIPSRMTYSFTAYDPLARLDKEFSTWLKSHENSFPMTVKSLVTAAATVAGVTVATNSWADSDFQVQYFYTEGITCRQIFSWAAEIAGMFVRCNTSGQAVFASYATKSGYKIAPTTASSGGVTSVAYKENGLTYANYTFAAVDGVAIHPTEEDSIAYVYPDQTTGNIVNIYGNLLLTSASAGDYTRVAQRLYTQYQGISSCRPFQAKLFPSENPFRAGDIVSVEDAQGVSFQGMVYSMSVTNTETILTSTGEKTFEEQTSQPSKGILTNLGANIVRLKNLFVENLEALIARIDNLFANEITVTGSLHSEDYVQSAGQPYANSGMALNFDIEEISAPYFAVDEYGNLFSNSAYFGDMYFKDTLSGANSLVNVAPTSMKDAGGQTSTNYAPVAYYRSYDYSTYNTRPGVIMEYEGYQIGEDGTLIYIFDFRSPLLRYLKFYPMCNDEVAEQLAPPHVKIYWQSDPSDPIPSTLLAAEFDLNKYGTYHYYSHIIIDLETVRQYFYYPVIRTSTMTQCRVEITMPSATSMRLDVARGYYSSFHSYDNNSVLGGDGTYVGTGGISAQNILLGRTQIGRPANPNLLDNWYFMYGGTIDSSNPYTNVGTFPVNQRGLQVYTSTGYIFDRWRKYNSTSITIRSDGVEIVASADGHQLIQTTGINVASLVGQTVTVTALFSSVSGGTAGARIIVGDSRTVPGASGDLTSGGLFSYSTKILSTDSGILGMTIRCKNGTTAKLIAAKLEIGDKQTLAHNEGTVENPIWVLNEVPNYGEQLAKCQRYFVRLKCDGTTTRPLAFGYSFNTTVMRFSFSLPQQMANPTVSVTAATGLTLRCYNGSSYKDYSPPSFTNSLMQGNSCSVFLTSSGLTANAIYVAAIYGNNAYLDFSCET